jgi:GNAT superfamily N-acetyltransferase
MATTTVDASIRPLRVEDVEAVERLSDLSYADVDRRTLPRALPEPVARSAPASLAWIQRTRHLVGTDPGGCWVAERSGKILGFSVSMVRESLWILASYAVVPEQQGHGIGQHLLAASLHHGRGCLRAMLCAGGDPAAVRRYRLAGFDLHPHMLGYGAVPRASLPLVRHVRDGDSTDFDLLNSLDRRTRGAAHLGDHDFLLATHRLIVSDRPAGSGYAYVNHCGEPVVVAATTRRTASALVWEALAGSDPAKAITIGHITANNAWLIDVALAAQLSIHQSGYLGVRHVAPPAPYVPHAALL